MLEIDVCGTVESWALESGIQLKESVIPKRLESRFQVPLTKTGIQYQESGIHGIDSRIQGCLGTLYMGESEVLSARPPLSGRSTHLSTEASIRTDMMIPPGSHVGY